MTDHEMLEAMKTLLNPIHIKLDHMENRISNIENRISNIENDVNNLRYEMKKGFRKTKDEIETLTEVLRAKGILPMVR